MEKPHIYSGTASSLHSSLRFCILHWTTNLKFTANINLRNRILDTRVCMRILSSEIILIVQIIKHIPTKCMQHWTRNFLIPYSQGNSGVQKIEFIISYQQALGHNGVAKINDIHTNHNLYLGQAFREISLQSFARIP